MSNSSKYFTRVYTTRGYIHYTEVQYGIRFLNIESVRFRSQLGYALDIETNALRIQTILAKVRIQWNRIQGPGSCMDFTAAMKTTPHPNCKNMPIYDLYFVKRIPDFKATGTRD